MARKQVNVSFTPEEYLAVQEAAAEEGLKVATYCHDAVVARAMPEPEAADYSGVPAWLFAFPAVRDQGEGEGCIAGR